MVNKIISDAAKRLKNSDSATLDARVLLANATGCENSHLLFREPDESELKLFESYIAKREKGVPVAYIIGKKEFMGLSFELNESTLIPRPDTECLVEKVIELNKAKKPKILDLCTGSGCIGISLAKFIDGAEVLLTDISPNALVMAKRNAKLNNVDCAVKKLDVLNDEIDGQFDVITANPPYIESEICKNLEVNKFEPTLALDGGEDGLTFYRIIAKKALGALNDGSFLALEIGYNQAESVKALLTEYENVTVIKDYGENDRVVVAYKKRM